MSETPGKQPTVLAYTIDLRAGYYRYVNMEGRGECREHFAQLVNDLEQGKGEVVMVAGVELLVVDTSTGWMETFITTAKRHGVLIADVNSGKDYDLLLLADEEAFRATEQNQPGGEPSR